MVMKPVTSQAAINNAVESTCLAISADTRKIPEPIIEPMTSMVELVRPNPFTNSRSLASSATATAALASVLKFSPETQTNPRSRQLYPKAEVEFHGNLGAAPDSATFPLP